MALEIRIATHEDWSVLNQLYADMDGEPPLPNDDLEKIFAEIAQVPNYHTYIAYLNQQPVGTFSLLYAPTMMHRGYHKFAVLDSVTVISSMRGEGIGSQMVKAALKLSADAGCYKVMLSSNLKRSRAHQFYQSLGFEQHGWSFKCVLQPTQNFG
ncbi:N-acetyltransferase family protein [Anabaena sp. FACHB-709]|uniref:GNAT family N-acetyltransferase n=2 Tax=Nostocaceae TaxID=1162 RepID=A0ABR7ZCD8_ANACY|nr:MULTISPECIES: GNAT family N-acetyltransferase [Nostocaceae]BAY67847.1 putative acetyltransferase [Trichormus variabilis NIES-23]HBW29596.1 GNAT family N-acetyltransferase [Nostoc sp. UBA8866]MBD2170062.1 GNAT family N-acetyltransferase [Anabaena cylindrica FACHB-318]MBD2261517.1 GNAT family N-acetyltransferase [Anabaena sp. FACHB-709]MBD2271101.1 GNAT family N-acetyltransferase [Nostoc sp. PCC 7120 = FACHB-418]